ncbi:MAG: HAMP domain-containing protein, partial [Bdellovibrionaceae bacterium]|nr:HAMP domain-containing protein [Pseudobdellovibrionaceae bacterium]
MKTKTTARIIGSKLRIPIWIKLFLVTIIILLAAMIPTAYSNYSRIKTESIDREWQIVGGQAESKAQEIRLVLSHSIEKYQFVATQLLNLQSKNEKPSVKDMAILSSDPHFLKLELVQMKDGKVESKLKQISEKNYADNKLNSAIAEDASWLQKYSLNQVFLGDLRLQNTTGKLTSPNGFPIGTITLGIPFSKDESGKIELVLLIDLLNSALAKPFIQKSESSTFLVDEKGVLLAHPAGDKVLKKVSFASHPLIVQSLKNLKMNQFQSQYKDSDTGLEMIGVFYRTGYGPLVVFQTPLSEVLAPAESVKREFIKNLAYAFFASIIFISLFSITLTKPIEKLASLINLVSKGQFDLNARALVASNDEVGDLAVAFDRMTEGLKERDKVKNLFSKFHGSAIANNLLKTDLVLGGHSKEVIVFFSDIRGFTAFSESRSAVDVVSMLNEYFAVMVEIINRNEGVVDKFIGDAIMAVWGAPESKKSDAKNAVKCCLEMRAAIEKLNAKRIGRGEVPLVIGMGLHAGTAISGTIGSNERMEFTVIGNTVNTASRVEASTKVFGTDLLITEQVVEQLDDSYAVDYKGIAVVKGRGEPIRMHQVRGYRNATGEILEIKTAYSDFV